VKRKSSEVTNAEAARLILAHPERHAGLPVILAELWMLRHETERKKPVSASASPRRAGTEEVTHERIATG
jgi:hypothetical protein